MTPLTCPPSSRSSAGRQGTSWKPSQSVVDHREPARGKVDPLAVDAGYAFSFGRRPIGEAGLCGKRGGRFAELAAAQRIEKIAGEDDPLPASFCKALRNEMIDPPLHCLANFGTEARAVERGFLGE